MSSFSCKLKEGTEQNNPTYFSPDCFILYLLVLSQLCNYQIKEAGTSPTKVWFPASTPNVQTIAFLYSAYIGDRTSNRFSSKNGQSRFQDCPFILLIMRFFLACTKICLLVLLNRNNLLFHVIITSQFYILSAHFCLQ